MIACLALVASLVNCGISTAICALKLKCYYEFFKCCGCIKEDEDTAHHHHMQQVEIVGAHDSLNNELNVEQNPFNIV